MPRRIRYVMDNKSFGEFIKSDQVLKPVLEAANEVAVLAGRLAPRSSTDSDGEHMADQFKVKAAGLVKISRNLRVKAEVYNDDPAAAPNEFGTRRNQRHRMLGRAGAAVGEFHDHGHGA